MRTGGIWYSASAGSGAGAGASAGCGAGPCSQQKAAMALMSSKRARRWSGQEAAGLLGCDAPCQDRHWCGISISRRSRAPGLAGMQKE